MNLWIGTTEEHKEEISDTNHILCIFENKESSEYEGYALIRINHKSHIFELRRIAIVNKGRGYGKEVMTEMLRFAFENLGINIFWLDVYPDNTIGIKLYESLGMNRDGILRQNYLSDRGYLDQIIYSMLKEEYMNMIIRDLKKEDYDFVLRVNEENVEVLSPMDRQRLEFYAGIADMFKIVEVNGKQAAFLIAIRDGADYPNDNFGFYSAKYPHFLYVDRIVIDEPYRKLGLGRMLYEAVKEHAKAEGVNVVTAEVDTEPVYNIGSIKFHENMGFREVGVQWTKRLRKPRRPQIRNYNSTLKIVIRRYQIFRMIFTA